MKRLYLILAIILVLLLIGSGVVITKQRAENTNLLYENSLLALENKNLTIEKEALETENKGLTGEVDTLNQKLSKAQETIDYCYMVTHPLAFPSVASLQLFLEWDTTDSNEYIEGVYTCADFAIDVMLNALAEGFLVSIQYELRGNSAHMINTALVGDDIWFFDPQTDELLFWTARY